MGKAPPGQGVVEHLLAAQEDAIPLVAKGEAHAPRSWFEQTSPSVRTVARRGCNLGIRVTEGDPEGGFGEDHRSTASSEVSGG